MELFKHTDAQSPLKAAKSEPPLRTISTQGYPQATFPQTPKSLR